MGVVFFFPRGGVGGIGVACMERTTYLPFDDIGDGEMRDGMAR